MPEGVPFCVGRRHSTATGRHGEHAASDQVLSEFSHFCLRTSRKEGRPSTNAELSAVDEGGVTQLEALKSAYLALDLKHRAAFEEVRPRPAPHAVGLWEVAAMPPSCPEPCVVRRSGSR